MAGEITKTECPITREEFKEHAKPLQVHIGETSLFADPREFSTGSLGFNISHKVTITIAGKPVKCQVSGNITCIGSKSL